MPNKCQTPVADLASLARWISHERLHPYDHACDADDACVVALYEWNAATAGAFFEALCHLEVMLRNAMHVQLTAWHGRLRRSGEWYDDPASVLSEHRRDDIAQARHRLARRGTPETPGRVVAELSMGFWRFLLDQRHQQILWAQALHRSRLARGRM